MFIRVLDRVAVLQHDVERDDARLRVSRFRQRRRHLPASGGAGGGAWRAASHRGPARRQHRRPAVEHRRRLSGGGGGGGADRRRRPRDALHRDELQRTLPARGAPPAAPAPPRGRWPRPRPPGRVLLRPPVVGAAIDAAHRRGADGQRRRRRRRRRRHDAASSRGRRTEPPGGVRRKHERPDVRAGGVSSRGDACGGGSTAPAVQNCPFVFRRRRPTFTPLATHIIRNVCNRPRRYHRPSTDGCSKMC